MVVPAAPVSEIPVTAIDALFAEWDTPNTPGCALAIVRDASIIYARGYGRASLEYPAPITPQTIFHVASISKQFTAFAIALLAHEGALNLDHDVRRYIPELPDFGHTITARHLIHHTSGLRDQWELLNLAGWRWDDVMTTADILELVTRQHTLNFVPGAEYAYCNTGYTLLGEIVARLSGMPFRDFCAKRIFEPLEMRATHVHDDHTEIVPGRAYSYYLDRERYRHAVLSYANSGATSLFTTVEDLARWSNNYETGTVGGPAVLAQMHEQGILNDGTVLPYAFGLLIGERHGRKTIEHAGADAGFRAHFLRYPEQRLAVIVLANAGNLNAPAKAYEVADLVLGEQKSEQVTGNGMALTPEAMAHYSGLYYSAATGQTRLIEQRDTELVLGPGGLKLQLVAEHTLQPVGMQHITLHMQHPADGSLLQLHERIGALPPIVYTKTAPTIPNDQELAAYTGSYASDELDILYTIAIENERLVIKRRKHGSTAFEPAFTDAFTGIADLQFTRNQAGQVDGFLLTTGRVRKIRFTRL